MTNRITSDIGEVVTRTGVILNTPVYYMFGHIAEVNKRLTSRNTNPALRDQKYPLVALRLDTIAKVYGGLLHYKLNIAILASTNKEYNAAEREQNVFIPILNPIYDAFFIALKESGNFMWSGFQDYPPHERIDRYFWSTPPEGKETKNIFTDPLDAIELINLEINSEIKQC